MSTEQYAPTCTYIRTHIRTYVCTYCMSNTYVHVHACVLNAFHSTFTQTSIELRRI